jgi:hypothetical protein
MAYCLNFERVLTNQTRSLLPTFTCRMIITIWFEENILPFFVTVSIFLFQVCRLVILMLLLAQCHKNILRPLQPLSFTLCDRSSINIYRHNQFLNVTVYVSDLCCLLLFWTLVVSCCMPSIISCLVYNLIKVTILAFVHVRCICVTKFAPLWVISSNL